MAATGFTPIQLYYSTTALATPTAGNLTNGELAINITDGKLFYKDGGGTIQVLASKAGASGDVVGPASATNNAVVLFDGTTGKLIKDSARTIASANTASTIVARDASGNFSAGTITAALSGNASTVTNGVYTTGTQSIGGAKTFTNDLTVSGTGTALLQTNGDITASRSGGTTGVIYFGNTSSRYLYWDGTTYYMPGGQLNVNGQTVLNAGNYASYALPISGSSAMTGLLIGVSSAGTNVNTNNDGGSFSVRGSSTTVASMSFHRTGAYAINMGLGTDNVFRIGGWSASADCFRMDGSGNLTMLANVTAYSDERKKKDWAPVADNFVEQLATIKSGTYTRIDIEERQAGASAQDWQKLLPEVVMEGTDDDKTLSLAYGNAAVVACIELAKEVVALKAEIAALKQGK